MTLHNPALIALSALAFTALTGAASAAKKMTYEQAFIKCKSEMANNVAMSETTTSAARYTVGAGCMRKYGYQLKK